MLNLYNKNGLLVRSEREIQQRKVFEEYITKELKYELSKINNAFVFHQCEASQLTPSDMINEGYTSDDVFVINDELTLRPETTMGSYEYARHILNTHNDVKQKLPVVVWQHGKSFRNEQDKVSKNMRLKEFYQLEYQIIYSANTSNDYHTLVVDIAKNILSRYFDVRTIPSDRLPDYSEKTTDIEMVDCGMEICSISQRKDFYTHNPQGLKEYHKVVEVAIGTDRLLYNFYKEQ